MVLDRLGKGLKGALQRVAKALYVDERLIKEVVREIQRALLQADVNVELVLKLTDTIQQRALKEKPPAGVSPREHVIRIVWEELADLMGAKQKRGIPLKAQRIMMVGLYGQGKTTTCAKIARYYQRKGLKPALIAADVHRPAAYEQLHQLGDALHIPTYGDPHKTNPVALVKDALSKSKEDVLILDTSGRHRLEPALIKEMKQLAKVIEPQERWLVLDGTMGQQAGPQARAFHDAIGITGVIITKLDGTARGGGAISAVAETGAPIVGVGVGEHIEDLEGFDPKRFVQRLLGMGDVQALLEKAEEATDLEQAEKTARKIMSGKFTLRDLYDQLEMLSKMGSLSKLMGMLPFGMRAPVDTEVTQEKLKRFRIIMDSMTGEEMEKPRVVNASRIQRIASGSGTDPTDVRELLRYYNTSKKAIKGIMGNRKMRRALMKRLRFEET